MENKGRFLTQPSQYRREIGRLGWALVLTLALWVTGAEMKAMFEKVSWERWILGIILLGAVWKPFGSILTTGLKNAHLHVAAGIVGVVFVASWLHRFAPLIQFFVGGVLCLAIWFLLLQLSKPSPPLVYPQPPPDEFRRYPLITGLMRAVMAGAPSGKDRIRRIALTGPWGCGKTFILDHVAYALQHHGLARAVKVSPWGAATPAQAMELLAEGMRRLLNEDSRGSDQAPIVAMFLKWAGAPDLESLIFSADSPRGNNGNIEKLNQRLGSEAEATGLRMVMIIDDMERAEPEVIRAMLPLLNELENLTHCTFLIAFNKEYLRSALRSYTDGPQRTKEEDAFLAKVVDFEIAVPDTIPRPLLVAKAERDISHQSPDLIQPHLNKWIPFDSGYPKLKAATSTIMKFLPQNPRIQQRFLDRARLLEACFLSDYDSSEKPFAAFFLLRLADMIYPHYIKESEKHLEAIQTSLFFMNNRNVSDSDSDTGFLNFRKSLQALDDDKIFDEITHTIFSHRFNFDAKTIEDNDTFRWCVHEYACPPLLPGRQRKLILAQWDKSEDRRFENFVEEAFHCSEDFDPATVMEELLSAIFSDLSHRMNQAFYPESDFATDTEFLEQLELVARTFLVWSEEQKARNAIHGGLATSNFLKLANILVLWKRTPRADQGLEVRDGLIKALKTFWRCLEPEICFEVRRASKRRISGGGFCSESEEAESRAIMEHTNDDAVRQQNWLVLEELFRSGNLNGWISPEMFTEEKVPGLFEICFPESTTERSQLLASVSQEGGKNQHVADVLKNTWIHRAYVKPPLSPVESDWDRTLWQGYQNALAAGLIDARTDSRIRRTLSDTQKK